MFGVVAEGVVADDFKVNVVPPSVERYKPLKPKSFVVDCDTRAYIYVLSKPVTAKATRCQSVVGKPVPALAHVTPLSVDRNIGAVPPP